MTYNQKIILGNGVISKILNIAISTSKIKHIYISGYKTEVKRPQMHCIIVGNLGSAKSTMLYEIGDNIGIVPLISFGKPHLYGTVDKITGILNPPIIWDRRNSCILADELIFNTKSVSSLDTLQGLLPILEYPKISKKTGFRVNDLEEKDEDLYLKVKSGTINCVSRFVFIGCTMENLGGRSSHWIKALISRCLILPHYPTVDELIKLCKGEGKFFNYEPYKVKPTITISKKDYDYIINYVKDRVKDPELILRTIGDLTRIFAVLKKHDNSFYEIIVKMKLQI